MNVSFREIAILALILLYNYLPAQIISVTPERPRATDLVTILFDATKGNQALLNYQNDVFAHTGVIVGTAENPSGWEYVQGDWGVPDSRMRMQYLGNNKYQIKFRIKEFYDLPDGVNFLQMSFVFRNANGSLIATEKDGSDIYYPDLDLFEYGPLEQAHGKDGENLQQMTDATRLDDGSIVIRDGKQALVVRPYADDLINLSYFPKGNVSISSTRSNNIEPKMLGEINKVRNDFEITLKDSFSLRVFTNPIRLELYRDELLLMSDERGCFFDDKDPLIGDMVGFRSTIQPSEALYETGPSSDKINRRGSRRYNYLGTSQKANNQSDQFTFPLLYSSKGYGLSLDNTHEGYLDLGEKEKSIMEIGVRDSMLSWYIIVGNEPKDIIKNLFSPD